MKRTIYFNEWRRVAWPPPSELEPYFLAPNANPWSRVVGGNDEWGLDVVGLNGTDDKSEVDQVNVHLTMVGTPDFGVFLHYSKWDGRIKQSQDLFSKGDMSRIREWLRTLQGDLRPIGLFIPYAKAWPAVKEFMERDGELPTSIEWIDGKDLPPNTFRFPGFFKPGPEPRVLRDEDINEQPAGDGFGFLRR
ncbi:MAG: hypothetical protein QM576_06075 [Rhodopseudomonas sp.]|uniref:hypothetical protein n=1 Tax=Rhodopseudomonas sp. TaxID=1078 RepID=UPI0039E4054A